MRAVATSIDIGPNTPLPLAASPDAHVPSKGTAEPIEAHVAVILDDYAAAPVVLVSLDLLYPGPVMRQALQRAFPLLPPAHLWLAASHTHRAPMTDPHKPELGHVDDSYLQSLVERLSGEIDSLLGQIENAPPATLSIGTAAADHSINRRIGRWALTRSGLRRQVLFAPNPAGVRDEVVSVLLVRDPSGRPIFVLWNYACHPVAFPAASLIAAHFPSVVRRHLQTHFACGDLPVLFLQGFSGNTRPSASVAPFSLGRLARTLAQGRGFCDMSWRTYAAWSESLAAVVVKAAEEGADLVVSPLVAGRHEIPTSHLVDGARAGSFASFQGLRIGGEFAILGASAEVMAEYALWLRELVSPAHLMCVGCIDDVFGYAPTEAMLHEGGYEGGGFCAAFGLRSVRTGIEQEMKAGFTRLLSDLGLAPAE